MSEAPSVATSGYLPDAPWSLRHFVFIFFGWLVGAIVGGTIAIAAGYETDLVGLFVFTVPAQTLGALGTAAFLSRRVGSGRWTADVGLRLRLRDWWGLPAGLGLQILGGIVTLVVIQVFGIEDPPAQGVVEVAEEADSVATAVLVVIGTVLLAAVVEEVMYRGVLLSWLAKTVSRHQAVLVSAALFAVVHLVDPSAILAVPGLFVIGLGLGYAAYRSQDLSLPLFMHAGVNLTAIIALFGEDLVRFIEEAGDSATAILRLL